MKLEGQSVVLRDWIQADIEVYKSWLEPHHEWHNFDGPYYPVTREDAERRIFEVKRDLEKNKFFAPRSRLVIADKKSNKLIGTVNCYWESKETNWLSAGISLFDPTTWGKGFGYEALTLWVDYLFEKYPEIVRLDFRTWSGNVGMMKLALKLGFIEEARFRKARIVNGQYYDGLAYGILREEWQRRIRS